MAGIPPMIGFFAKQMVLYSVSYNYSVISIVAIVISVIGASYYLKIVKLMFFDNNNNTNTIESTNTNTNNNNNDDNNNITTVHSSIISILTLTMTLYLFDSSILLNACHLISLSVFNN